MEIDWSAVDRWIMGESWVGSRVSEHLQILTDRLAPRWAGSDGEGQTIDYLVDQWRDLNLNQPRSENFSFNTWDPGVARLTVKGDDCWKAEIRPFLFCPPASINAPLVDVGYGMPHELEAIGARLSGAIAICNSELEPFSPARTFPNRVQDIAFLAIGICHKRNTGAPVRVILNGRNLCGNVEFIPLEINNAVGSLVPATTPPDRHLSLVVPTT